MSLSQADSLVIGYVEETEQGTTPSSALQNIYITSESLQSNRETISSNRITGARNSTDALQTGNSVSGNIDFEFMADVFDDFLEGALMSDWSTGIEVTASTISVDSTSDSYTDSENGFPDGLLAGERIYVSGCTDSSNNGWKTVVSDTTGEIVVEESLVDETAGASVTISGKSIRNGSTKHFYTLEKDFSDLETSFQTFTGNEIDTMSLSYAIGSILTGSFGFLGYTETMNATSQGTGTPTSAVLGDVLESITNLSIGRDGTSQADVILSANINTSNSKRVQQAIGTGSLDPVGVADGEFVVTGDMELFLRNVTSQNLFLNDTEFSLNFTMSKGANSYIIDLPKVKMITSIVPVTGKNTDVMQSVSWQAFGNDAMTHTIQISKII